MRLYLSLISILLLFGYSPCLARGLRDAAQSETDSVIVQEYSLLTRIKGRDVTGICVINISADSSVVGTVVNEFGIKVFDFSYNQEKVKVFNAIAPLNKWYIRKILRKDFLFILSHISVTDSKEIVDRKRTMRRMADGKIEVENRRYKIMYTLVPIKVEE